MDKDSSKMLLRLGTRQFDVNEGLGTLYDKSSVNNNQENKFKKESYDKIKKKKILPSTKIDNADNKLTDEESLKFNNQ